MKFKLWGTRGSIPSPLLTQDIEGKIQAALSAAAQADVDLNDPAAIRAFVASLPYAIRGTAGGDTSCVEVRSAGNLFILDCGSGIRQLGLELMKEEFGRGKGVAHLFMSHTHWDHMMGWPYFVPVYIPGNQIHVYGVHPNLEERFRLQQTAPSMFPKPLDYMAGTVTFTQLQEGDSIQIGQTRIQNVRFDHPGDAFGYRFEDDEGTLVYASDSEYTTLDREATQHIVEFFRDADALIFDAMYTFRESYGIRRTFGHGYAVAGANLATRAGVKRLLLYHHDPTYPDEKIWSLREEAEAYLRQHPERPPCEVIVAYDGFEMELWRKARLETRIERLPQGIAIHLSGRLAQETATIALDAIDKAAAQALNQPLVVNLEQIVHVDQDGLSALFTARQRRRPLALSGLSAEVRRSFAKAGALDYLATFDTPDEALLTMKQGLDLRPGQVLNERYGIEELLNRGPLGDLYLATDLAIHRQVTILIICPSLGHSPTESLMEAARAAVNLRHPLIASVLDAGQDGPIKYLVTEHIPGQSVRQLINADGTPTAISPVQAVHITIQVTQALKYAHGRGLVHGTLKPENIILAGDQVKMTNFGIGRLEIDKPLSELPVQMDRLDYLAPEQIQGRGHSPASDLYALGVILYEMLTGHPPFAATTSDADLISLQLRQPPVPPRRRNPNLSRSLGHLVLNLVRKSPQERPFDAGVVHQTLLNLTSQSDDVPLLGQDLPQQKLHYHLEDVARGRSKLLIVHGPKGIGKSRLILSVASEQVTDQALTTLHGELFANEDSRTYKLFVQALRHTLLNLPAHRLRQLLNELGDLASPLTVLIPDLRPLLSAFAPSDTKGEQLEQAMYKTLCLMADQGPVMLVLDGLQWIDVASLRFLSWLICQRIPHLLIVGLYRTEEVDQEHPLRQALEAWEPWIDDQLSIAPLGPIDVHKMASTLIPPHQVPPDFGLWLYGETEGNPLHITQLVKDSLEGHNEIRHFHEWTSALTLEEVILRRLERLPSNALATLRQAAVLGHTFHFGLLRSILAQPEQQVLAHLDNALQIGILQGHPSDDRYNFSHPLVREVLYTEMLGGVRKRLHRRTARVLTQGGTPASMDERIDLLAHHFLRAGEREQAINYLARASRRARELHAHDASLNYINQALQVVEQLVQRATDEQELAHRKKQREDLLAAQARLEADVARITTNVPDILATARPVRPG
jgi:serine/threonine protein kinase/phosphoribosyl 1,2-cyclic phosphodiesterase/anti-anti-sigma regulatory factor